MPERISILNYNILVDYSRGDETTASVEADCSPHAVDVLAVYALYQN